jgi:site-specific DNA-methyltransferase (adenine-specific)
VTETFEPHTQLLEGRLYLGDCADVLSRLNAKFDLVYLDPPFFLEREFRLDANNPEASFKGDWSESDRHPTVEALLSNAVDNGMLLYLSWLYRRLEVIKECMNSTASIFVHVGTREATYLTALLDHLFGPKQWRSTITWQRSHPHNNVTKSLGNVSDLIMYYTISDRYAFNLQYTAHDEKYLRNSFKNSDSRGYYALAPIIQERSRSGHDYSFRGYTPPNGWRVKEGRLKELDEEGRIHWGERRPYKKVYKDEAPGAALQNIWTDVHNITRTEIDQRKYPTQKPIALLERIISLASNEGDRVLDPFCGSGTTALASLRHGREFVGIDRSRAALEIASQRLLSELPANPDLQLGLDAE